MCQRFDLRFIVIADRFPSSRTVEELKDRYYSGICLSFCLTRMLLLTVWFPFMMFLLCFSMLGFFTDSLSEEDY